MRRHAMPEVKEGSVNVTPLIDVVMCLIIFFMLVAKIGVVTGNDKNIIVPQAFMGNPLTGSTVTLNIAQSGMITAQSGNALAELKLDVTTMVKGKPQDQVQTTLEYYRFGDSEHNMPANPDLQVIIRGDKSLSFDKLAPVLIDCTRAKVKSWAFAANLDPNPVTGANDNP